MPPFEKGHSGNPAGRPLGARNKVTLMLEEMLQGEAEAIMRKAIAKAKVGDPGGLRLCLDRLVAPRKNRPVQFEFPKLETVADAAAASVAIVEAVAAGDLTPYEAAQLSNVLDAFTRTLQTGEIEQRLARLEAIVTPDKRAVPLPDNGATPPAAG
jgi:hypothetical protein